MEEKFTIQEIKNYLTSCDSFGDAVYFLSAEKIKEANPKDDDFIWEDELSS